MKVFEPAVRSLAMALRGAGLKLATAESCTGGLIAAACTAVAGSSDWFERGFVTYSNEAKSELLGVGRTEAMAPEVDGSVILTDGNAFEETVAAVVAAIRKAARPGAATTVQP